jgi:hypothetical protein
VHRILAMTIPAARMDSDRVVMAAGRPAFGLAAGPGRLSHEFPYRSAARRRTCGVGADRIAKRAPDGL